MLHQSITGRILMRLKTLFLQYNSSLIYQTILRCGAAIKSKFETGCIHAICTLPSKLEALYETSVIYAAANFVTEKCIDGIHKVGVFFENHNQNSLNHTLYTVCKEKGYLRFAYICALFFVLMLLVPHDYWNNLYAFVAAVLLSGVYVLLCAQKNGLAKNVRALPTSLLLFAVSIPAGICITPAPSDGLRVAFFFLTAILFMLLCAGGIPNQKTLHGFLRILLIGLGIFCSFAIIQRFIGVEVNPEFTDIANNEGMPGRVYSTVSNPNNFAEILVLLLPFAYALLLNTKKTGAKLAWGVVILLALVALAMSYSRSCYIAFALTVLIFIALYDWRWLLPLGIFAIFCIPLLPETVLNRILTIGSMSDSSNATRIYIWDGVFAMMREHGITGIGLGPKAFGELYPPFAHDFARKAVHSHMLYMEMFVELGLIGGISFLVFMFSCIKKALATYNHTNQLLRNIIIAGIASLGGISFVAAVEYIWFYPRVMFIFWIVLGIVLCAIRLAKREN